MAMRDMLASAKQTDRHIEQRRANSEIKASAGKIIDGESCDKSAFNDLKESLKSQDSNQESLISQAQEKYGVKPSYSQSIESNDINNMDSNEPLINQNINSDEPKKSSDSEIYYAKPQPIVEEIQDSKSNENFSTTNQKIGKQHCNIVANVIKQSGSTFRGDTSWDNCKFLKISDGNYFCTEFHSLCGRERCKRATR
ncbi:MAG: hypothetical protein PHQ98_00585 [Candidatus ainarchaeum sp.]|nr:hypothetical protein [Candidatus ainarchaeum sp.]